MFSNFVATFFVAFLAQHVSAAGDIREKMNTNVDPCNDFYQFACGNYGKKVKLGAGEAERDPMVDADTNMMRDMRAMLEAPSSPKDSQLYEFAKKYYRGCMNVDALEKLGLRPLQQLFDSLGGWPVAIGEKWNESSFDWMDHLAQIYRNVSYQQIFTFKVKIDLKNNTRRILEIDQSPPPLIPDADYFLNKKYAPVVEAYRTFLYSSAVKQFGANETRAKLEIDAVIDLETKIANISVKDEDRRDPGALYNVMTVAELKSRFPKIPFDTWFSALRRYGFDIAEDQLVNVPGTPYLDRLGDVISTTDKRTLANYLMVGPLFWGISVSAPSLKEYYRQYRTIAKGPSEFLPRWQSCVRFSRFDISWPIAAMYVREFVNASTKAEVQSMVTRLVDAMRQTIINSFWWMDDETKVHALAKLAKLQLDIAYPDFIFNDTYIMQDFDGIVMDENDFFTSSIRADQWYFNADRRMLKEPSGRSTWENAWETARYAQPVSAQAYLLPNRNALVLSAGLLEEPMYFANGPKYVNYARMGSTLGREVSRGYDDTGRRFDGDGRMNMWWTNDTLNKFETAAKCFIQEFTITDPLSGITMDGEAQLSENLADSGGLKIAYQAFKASQNDMTSSDTVPAEMSQYTMDQLFFISYAQTYCDVEHKAHRARELETDSEAPNNYRVTIPLKNFDAFANAFKCPQGSPMNPRHECVIW